MKLQFEQDELVNYLKNYGFIFNSSEIYGGLSNTWDYGPIGVLLKNNIKAIWWREFCTKNPEAYGLDSSILMNRKVWEASGHVSNFSDPLIDCKNCHNRFRADKLIEEFAPGVNVTEATPLKDLYDIIIEKQIKCPVCGKVEWTEPRKFNLMFKTNQGVVEDAATELYLRPETAQGIFVDFMNIQRTTRAKLPFVVCQIGKAFRNEITPGNFIFRTREFEQMEMEYFCYPQQADAIFNQMVVKINNFLANVLTIDPQLIRQVEHKKEELSHYSSRTIDFQFLFPHGWGELWGLANRTNYDLSQHQKHSGKDIYYLDPTTNEKLIPSVVEPSVGCDRLFYAVVASHYKKETINDDVRELLALPYDLVPYKIAVLPLVNKLNEEAKALYLKILELGISATFDTSGTIGRRYRRQDAIGTYYCITVDFDSLKHKTITIRNRDTTIQDKIKIRDLIKYLNDNHSVF